MCRQLLRENRRKGSEQPPPQATRALPHVHLRAKRMSFASLMRGHEISRSGLLGMKLHHHFPMRRANLVFFSACFEASTSWASLVVMPARGLQGCPCTSLAASPVCRFTPALRAPIEIGLHQKRAWGVRGVELFEELEQLVMAQCEDKALPANRPLGTDRHAAAVMVEHHFEAARHLHAIEEVPCDRWSCSMMKPLPSATKIEVDRQSPRLCFKFALGHNRSL